MSMYNLREYIDNHSKTLGSLWQYHRDESPLNNAGSINDFPDADNYNTSFKFKQKIAGPTENDGTKDVKIMVPLKYLSHF